MITSTRNKYKKRTCRMTIWVESAEQLEYISECLDMVEGLDPVPGWFIDVNSIAFNFYMLLIFTHSFQPGRPLFKSLLLTQCRFKILFQIWNNVTIAATHPGCLQRKNQISLGKSSMSFENLNLKAKRFDSNLFFNVVEVNPVKIR